MGTFDLGFSLVRITHIIEHAHEEKTQGKDGKVEDQEDECVEERNEGPLKEEEGAEQAPGSEDGEEGDWDSAAESGTEDSSVGDSEIEEYDSSVEEDEEQDDKEMSKAKDKGISKEAYDECKEAFKLFDRDGNGTISYDELADVMRLLGNNPTEEDIADMMKGLDDDNNGTIDFEEFMAIMISHWKDPVNEEEELLHAFEVFDRNKDGYVVAEEIRFVMKSLGHTMTDAEIDVIIKEGDSNGDGRLDYHEFIKVMQGRL